MKRALIVPLLLAASTTCVALRAAATEPEPLPVVAQFNISPAGVIRYTELVRPEGFSRVEAEVRGADLWITAVGADGNRQVLHRYFDPLAQKKMQSFTAINCLRGDVSVLADGTEMEVKSNAFRGRTIGRSPSLLGNYLAGLVNESLANHDQSNVSQTPFLATPMLP